MLKEAKRIGVGHSAAILAGGGLIEFALQFLVPILLVRHLDTAQFGHYRLLMLSLGTALALAPAFMPQSLYYYLPGASDARRRIVIGNVLLYLAMAGLLVALVASPLNPVGGRLLHQLFEATHGMSALFLGLSVLLSVTTTIAIAEGRILWHCSTDLCLGLLRAGMVAMAAIAAQDIGWVVAAMVAHTLIRVLVVVAYLATRPGGPRLGVQPALLGTQLCYALPFALGASLFAMRSQADQWIVASMLPSAAFAAFTIGAVVLPVASLIRQPINSAMLSSLGTEFAAGRTEAVRRLLLNGSSAATLILVPLAGTLFVLAPDIVALVYTEQYLAAVPVMRVYLVLIMMQSVAIGYAMPVLDLGKTAVRVNFLGLLVSVGCGLAGVWCFGLAGGALGSVVAFALSEFVNMKAIARLLGLPLRQLLPLRLLAVTAAASGVGLSVAMLVDAGDAAHGWQAVALRLGLYGSTAAGAFLLAGGIGEIREARGHADDPVGSGASVLGTRRERA